MLDMSKRTLLAVTPGPAVQCRHVKQVSGCRISQSTVALFHIETFTHRHGCRCVVIEDSHIGVRAARAAGMR